LSDRTSNGSWRCPAPPQRGRDERLCKSDPDFKYWEKGAKRQLGELQLDIPSLKRFYEEKKSEKSSDKSRLRNNFSTSSGSDLSVNLSIDSFEETYEVQNKWRNKERAEMR
jgi:hypothetical protein